MQVAPQDYQHVPIDIQTSKLLDWLLDRRHCGRRWPEQVQRVRERIQAALEDMPEHPEIRELLRGNYLHYFHCLRIVEILRGTEASTRNLFGRYSSQRMKDWQEIVSLYEKENAYLAELASLLGRGVGFEAPALRRQLGRCQQAQQELARREDECQVKATELRDRFLGCCRQYGIAGGDVRQELLAQVEALPSLLSRIGDGASALGDAIELYQACVAFVCDSPGVPEELPLLRAPAGPRDREGWAERLREEYRALIQYVENNKRADTDWFRLESNPEGTRWSGRCWYIHELLKYEFNIEFEIPVTYPGTAPEIAIPELDGKTAKMYRGGKICLSDHFKPLWARNVPKFGLAHLMALGLGPWLAVEIPDLISKGLIQHKDK